MKGFLQFLHVKISKEAALSALTNSFFDEIRSRVDRYALSTDFNSISKYFGEKNGVVISTLHGVKGEEYNESYSNWSVERIPTALGLYSSI